jgi:hypothetical protein
MGGGLSAPQGTETVLYSHLIKEYERLTADGATDDAKLSHLTKEYRAKSATNHSEQGSWVDSVDARVRLLYANYL